MPVAPSLLFFRRLSAEDKYLESGTRLPQEFFFFGRGHPAQYRVAVRIAAKTIDNRLMAQFELQLIAIIQFGIQLQRLPVDQRRLRVHKGQIKKPALFTAQAFALTAANGFLRQDQRHAVAGK